MTRFVIAPLWQGSPSARAMLLADGAEAIAGDLPASACVRIDVPVEAGDDLGTAVHRLSVIAQTREAIAQAVTDAEGERALVIGGDCSVALGAVAALAGEAGDLAVVWFDSHGDLHTPESSASGAFAGMVLRSIVGEGPAGIALDPAAVGPGRAVLAGARDLDLAEHDYLARSGMTTLTPERLADPAALVEAVAATGARRVFVHIDLDVLGPENMTGLSWAVPFGVAPAELVAAVRALRDRFGIAGASLSGFAPASPQAAVDDLGTILRIIGALA